MEPKKKKLNIKKLLVFILFLYLIGSFLFVLLTYPIKNIYVLNNINLTDQEIIDIAGLRDYPSLLFTTKSSIINKLKRNPLISSVNVEKTIKGKITITVKENRPLFYDAIKQRSILSNMKEVENKYNIPILINSMPKEIYKNLIESLYLIDEDVLLKLSEIEYAINDKDTERFLIKTTDKIRIYVNILKFEDLNYYNELLPTLNNKTGTWYLDYGNYFVSDW